MCITSVTGVAFVTWSCAEMPPGLCGDTSDAHVTQHETAARENEAHALCSQAPFVLVHLARMGFVPSHHVGEPMAALPSPTSAAHTEQKQHCPAPP